MWLSCTDVFQTATAVSLATVYRTRGDRSIEVVLVSGLSGCHVRGPEHNWRGHKFGCSLLLDGRLLGKRQSDLFRLLYPEFRLSQALLARARVTGPASVSQSLLRQAPGPLRPSQAVRPAAASRVRSGFQSARQIGRIGAFHKGFARAGTVKTVMFSDQGAPDVTAIPLHALHGL